MAQEVGLSPLSSPTTKAPTPPRVVRLTLSPASTGSGVVALALGPANAERCSAKAAPSPDVDQDDVNVLPPRITCCYRRRAPAARSPASAVGGTGKAALKFSSAMAETVAAYGVSEAALAVFLSNLPPPSTDACSASSSVLDGQPLDTPDAVNQWRSECRRVRRLSGQLHDKESSHARLMSIRPHSVRTNEVKAYQGLYQAMMRLRNDSQRLASQKDVSQSVCSRLGQTACRLGQEAPALAHPPHTTTATLDVLGYGATAALHREAAPCRIPTDPPPRRVGGRCVAAASMRPSD